MAKARSHHPSLRSPSRLSLTTYPQLPLEKVKPTLSQQGTIGLIVAVVIAIVIAKAIDFLSVNVSARTFLSERKS